MKISKILQSILIAVLLVFFTKNSFAQSAADLPITTDSRIKTLVYNPNEVYQLKFYYGYQSFIEFSEDESIEMISIGESFAWRLTPAGKRLFIRPLEIAAHTNMSIITNKRAYQFDIQSGEYDGKSDQELVYVVRFFYPDTKLPNSIPPQLSRPNPGNAPTSDNSQNPNKNNNMAMGGTGMAAGMGMAPNPQNFGAPNMRPQQHAVIRTPASKIRIDKDLSGTLAMNSLSSKINFNYQFAGTAPEITPIKVFDNGQETSFQFKNNNLVIPTINVVDNFGNENPIGYVIKDNYIVVPIVANQFTLRLADSVLCIFNNKLIK